MVDYVALAQIAAELVAADGRVVQFVKFSQQPEDPSKPWRGPADPRDYPELEEDLPAVFVPPSSASSLGLRTELNEMVKMCEQICIVAPGPEFAHKLEEFDEIVDADGVRWLTVFTETLKPANLALCYFVGVKR